MKKCINGFQYLFYTKLDSLEKMHYCKEMRNFLIMLTFEYPFFFNWYEKLFTINCELQNEREIVICTNQNEVVGLSILKKTELERKICTLRVKPAFQGVGIGKQLMENSINWLECEKPLITLRKTKQHQFEKLFYYYGFELEQKNFGYYRMFSTELSFNGVLPKKVIQLRNFEIIDWSGVIQKIMLQGNVSIDRIIKQCVECYGLYGPKLSLDFK